MDLSSCQPSYAFTCGYCYGCRTCRAFDSPPLLAIPEISRIMVEKLPKLYFRF
eukprot:m.83633 g.83633  ORF g.83633 m.83633 type:complete len:53 (+) comp36360_c1_seq5:992-1150(+)